MLTALLGRWTRSALLAPWRRRPALARRIRFPRAPELEWLEQRLAPAGHPVPTAILTAPSTNLIGEDVPLSVSFSNTGSPSTAVGYGPFIDVVLPTNGTPGPDDGISFNSGSATYLGLPVSSTVLTFDASGHATHPFAKNSSGNPVVITGTPGDELVVFQLPFGSYTVGQPPATIDFTGHLSDMASINTSLPITAQGGFQFGADPLDDPTTDPTIFGPTDTASVTPTVFKLTKIYNGPEDETATGPNFPQTYTLNVDVANGQTLTNFNLTDQLPSNMQFVSVTSVTGNGTTTFTSVSRPSTTTPGGTITEKFDQIVGTAGTNDAQLTFQFYIPLKNSAGTPVLPLGTGTSATATDHSSAKATWQSPNPALPAQTVKSSATDPDTINTLTAKSLAIQKSAAVVIDTGSPGPTPGDTLEYTLNFQVSDFFALANVLASDIFSDGQEFDTSFAPTITYSQHGTPVSGTFSNANYSAAVGGNGSTTVTFDVSSELQDLGLASAPDLLGAAIPDGGTGGPKPVPNPPGPGTTGTITFRTTILNNYRVTPSPNAPVVQGDVLGDSSDIQGDVLKFADLSNPGKPPVSDNSSASVSINRGTFTKTLYAVNGVVAAPASIKPGDDVTFALEYTLPTSSIVNYQLTDFLPLPIFQVGPTTFDPIVSAAAPAVGTAQFGPDDTYFGISNIVPTVTANTASNSLNFNFGNFQDPSNRASVSEVLFTVDTSDLPFADGLLLTNQAQQTEGSETGGNASQTSIVPLKLSEPDLAAHGSKGVVSTSDPRGQFSGPVGPASVTFAAPGLPAPAFTGTVTSLGLATQPIDATLSNIDAGDLVKFALVLQNVGSSANGVFNVTGKDMIPAGFAIPTTGAGLNLQVDNGTGAPIPFTDLGGGLFGNGIELNDPSPTMGSLGPGKDPSGNVINNGLNIAVITYDLVTTGAVTPLQTITNTATLTNFASEPGGPNFIPGGLEASTSVTIAAPTATKTLLGTSIVNSVNTTTQAVIGELATYQVHVTIPEGTTPGATIMDTLPPGLAFVSANTPVFDPGVDPASAPLPPTVSNNGQLIDFNLGTVINSNTDNVARGLTLTYQVVVLNVASNVNGTQLTNSAQVAWTDHNIAPVSAPPITVIEPKLKTTKSVVVNGSGTTGQAGNPVTYTITIQQDPSSPTDAFDVTFADPLPQLPGGASVISAPTFTVTDSAGLVTSANFALTGSDATGYVLSTTGTGFDLPRKPTSRVITLTIKGTLAPTVTTGTSFTNTDTVQWTSLPGSPGQISTFNPDSTERTGAGGVNNYVTSASATLNIIAPTVAKKLVSTSIVSPSNSNTQAVIGELVNYSVTVTVPHGVTKSATLVDTLPAGLAFVQDTGFTNSNPAKVTFPGSGTSPTVTNSGQTVTFTLGDVTNADMDPGKVDTLTFTYQAVVLNVASNVSNAMVTNSAALQFNTSSTTPSVSAAPVTIIEPKLQTVKTASPTTAEAGDVITYTVVLSHAPNSQTDAFDVNLSDVIPAGQTFVPGSLQNTAGVAATSLAFDPGTGTITAAYNELPLGTTSTLTYQVTLDTSVTPGQNLVNTANNTWTSLPGNPGQISSFNPNSTERTGAGGINNYQSSASAMVTTLTPGIAKALVGTSIVNPSNSNTQAVIGETVTYQVTVTVPQGTTPSAHLVDTLPAGLAFVQDTGFTNSNPADVTFPGSGTAPTVTNSGQLVDFNLGTITNTDTNSAVPETLTFTYQAVVLNVASNINGVQLTNQAAFTSNNGANTTGNVSAPPVTVIEPKLDTTKSVVVGGEGGNPGDPVTYTITIKQDPASAADAFNVTLNDVLPSQIVNPTLTSVVDTGGIVNNSNFTLTGNTLTTTGTGFDLPKLPAGRVITLTVTGTLGTNVSPGQNIVNNNAIQWTSLPGNPGQISTFNPNSFERTGNPGDPGQLNNYATTGSAAFPVRSADLQLTKTVSDPTPNVGDTITYTVTLTNLGPNTAHNVSVSDSLPAGLTFVASNPSQPTYDPVTGIWTVGTVGVGAVKTLTITATVTSPDPQTNLTTVSASDELDPVLVNNTATATITPQQADLAVSKTVDNPTPKQGDTITYTVTVTNNGPDTATNVIVIDSLPAGVRIRLNPIASQGHYHSITGFWNIGTLDVGQTATLTVTTVVTDPNAVTNTAFVPVAPNPHHPDQFDPDPDNNSATTSVAPQQADLAVTKVVDNPTPNVGDTVTFTVTLTNLGPDTAGNVTVSDPLPTGLTFVSASPQGSYDPGSGIWTVGTVPPSPLPGSKQTLTIQALVGPPPPNAETNTATVETSDQFDPNLANNTATATVTPQQADLAVNKVVSNPTPNVGDVVTFAVILRNLGPNTATNVVVNDPLPAGLTLISDTASQGSYNSMTGDWTVGTVSTAAHPVLRIRALVGPPPPNTETNTATVSHSDQFDPNHANNTDDATVTPQQADLAVTKTVDDPAPNVGDIVTYTVSVQNLGPDTATHVVVTDPLPPGLTLVQASPSQGTYNSASGVWTVGTVTTLVSPTLTIRARVVSPNPETNSAQISHSDQFDPDPGNNGDHATITPQLADLAVNKKVDDPTPNVGDVITYTVTLTNNGPGTATNVSVSDPLPSGLTFVADTASQGSYDAASGIWTVGTVTVGAGNAQTLTIQAKVVAGTVQTNVAAVQHSDQYDPVPGNNKDLAIIKPQVADLVLNKVVSNPTPVLGSNVTYTLIVHNNGPSTATNVMVVDPFPSSGLTLIAANPSQGTFDQSTGIWMVGTLASGATARLNIVAQVTALGPIVNTADASSDVFDPNLGNNRSTAIVSALSPADLISKRLFLASSL